MTDELITPDNLSKELLKSVLDAAYMDTSYDRDGDLVVKERLMCFVFPGKDRKDSVRLLVLFTFEPETSELKRLQAVNKINQEYLVVKAFVSTENHLHFTWDIPIEGGITKKAFVMAVKRFCSIPHDAVEDCAKDVVE